MKKLFTIFLATPFPFALFMLIKFDFSISVLCGLTFGLLMTIILGVINYFSLKQVGGEAASSVKKEKEIELQLSYENSFELCKNSLSCIKGASITHEDFNKGIIRAKTGVNLKTWGDKIEFHIQKISDEVSKVWIQSMPIIPTTLVDYGKNLNNIKKISNYLQEKR